MPTRFRPYQPKQMLMLPPDLREWVPDTWLIKSVSWWMGWSWERFTGRMKRTAGATRPMSRG